MRYYIAFETWEDGDELYEVYDALMEPPLMIGAFGDLEEAKVFVGHRELVDDMAKV